MNRGTIELSKLKKLDTEFKESVEYVNNNFSLSNKISDTDLLHLFHF